MLKAIIILLGTILSFNSTNIDDYKTYAITKPKTDNNTEIQNNNSDSKTLEEVLEEQYNSDHLRIDWSTNLPVKDEYEFSIVNLE